MARKLSKKETRKVRRETTKVKPKKPFNAIKEKIKQRKKNLK